MRWRTVKSKEPPRDRPVVFMVKTGDRYLPCILKFQEDEEIGPAWWDHAGNFICQEDLQDEFWLEGFVLPRLIESK